ncbi:MAG: hypothetical protein R2702_19760 [Acidimicrobiales bacterium]
MQRELEAQLVELHARARPLPVERQRQLRRVGQVEREVVRALGPDPGAGGEHALGRLPEGDRDDPGALRQALAGAQEERDAGPAPVVDLAAQGDERLGLGLGRHPRLVAVAQVLAADHLRGRDRHHRAEHLVLLLADGEGLEGRRRFHRHERQHLEQVGHDHVAVGAGRLVEPGAGAEREGLGHVDLHVVDVVSVPDGLEQAVGEAEGEDVLGRLLAEEVVDAEHLLLAEHLVHRGVQDPRRAEVHAEGLLHDHPGALDEIGVGEHGDHLPGGGRGHAQVVEPAAVAAEVGLGPPDRAGQGVGAVALGDVRDGGGELLPGRLVPGAPAELAAGVVGEGAEGVVVELLERGGDDPAPGHQPSPVEVEQAGEQLAPGQVAGAAEEHDDVAAQRRHQRGADVVRFAVGLRHVAPRAVGGDGTDGALPPGFHRRSGCARRAGGESG